MQYAVVGVQFKQVGKKYFFDPNGFSPQKGDYVLVETIRGMEFGTVVIEPRLVDEEDVFLPLKPVLRIATEEDIQKNKQNKPKKRLKKRLNTFFFSLFVMGVIGGVFYFTSPLRKLSMVYFEGLNYVSRSEVLQLANLSYDDDYFKLKTKKIASQIQKHPLITKAVVTRVGLNELRILVEEKDVIGCVDMGDGYQYVLSDGHLIEQSNTLDVVCPCLLYTSDAADD